MSNGRLIFSVEYQDGETHLVTADQRDTVAFERDERIPSTEALKTMPNAYFWSLTFYALRRTGLVEKSVKRVDWEGTVSKISLEVSEAADPGKPAARAGSPSSSPKPPASRTTRSASTGQPKT